MELQRQALQEQSIAQRCLYLSFELSDRKWILFVGDGIRNPSSHVVAAADRAAVMTVVAKARHRCGLGAEAPVISCYEAGRDGFWLHRWLTEQGVRNHVVDAASIEVDRRARRTKTDRIDGRKLYDSLLRYCGGEPRVWSVLRVPSEAAEDARRPYRERERLKGERTAHVNRIGELLVLHNVRVERIGGRGFSRRLTELKVRGLPAQLGAELERESARLALVIEQLARLERELAEQAAPQAVQLQRLRALGPLSATGLVVECFGWRRFRNRRELAASCGLVGSPYASGASAHEQGISKAGNRRLRWLLVELGWNWLRYQPESELSRWFNRRFGAGGKRLRRIGIVALARRLLIALWRYLEQGVIPAGAQLKALAATRARG